jgi:hypothetical protein
MARNTSSEGIIKAAELSFSLLVDWIVPDIFWIIELRRYAHSVHNLCRENRHQQSLLRNLLKIS